MSHIFLEITAVVVIATVLGMVAKALKQPTMLGYLATGIIVGPLGFLQLNNVEVIDAMAEIGIALLLFLVGMELRLSELRHVGRAAVIGGIGQIVFTSLIGLVITMLLGYAFVPALYIAVALTFSSTIIVVKLLNEKGAMETLYGRIVVGFLLVQDFVALFALIIVSGIGDAAGGGAQAAALAAMVVKGVVLFAVAMLVGRYVITRILAYAGRSQEALFLVSLAWGMGMAALVTMPWIGFTVEIGAFLAGIAMADSIEHYQISSRVRSLQDFFIVMFFVTLGSRMAVENLGAIWVPTLLLSLFVLIGNPLIVLVIMGAMGYRSRTSFLASVTVAQISEFSLILVALGARRGIIGDDVVSLVTAVGIITIVASSYMIQYSERLYELLKPALRIFEFRAKGLEDAAPEHSLDGHIVLVGCHRMGQNILASLEELHSDFLVVDFNPEVIHGLIDHKAKALYGDIADPEIQRKAGLDRARLVISTIPSYDESMNLLRYVRTHNPDAKVVLTGETELDAVNLYEEGADYVLLPHFIGGLQLANLILEDRTLDILETMRLRDLRAIAGAG